MKYSDDLLFLISLTSTAQNAPCVFLAGVTRKVHLASMTVLCKFQGNGVLDKIMKYLMCKTDYVQ